jgi:hypothetical protein
VLNIQTAGTTAITVDASQNVGINNTTPSFKIDAIGSTTNSSGIVTTLRLKNGGVASEDGTKILFTSGTSTDGAGIGSGGQALNSADLRFYAGGNTERARIDSSGNLLVGTTSSSSRFKVAADGTNVNSEFYQPAATSYTSIIFTNPSGTAGSITTAALTTTYGTTSDYRLKENVVPMVGALNTIAQLKPVTYKWKVDGSDGQGFIAHELQSVVPDCVTGEKDAVDAEGNPKYQGIDTSFLVATLTAAIQELKAEFDAYKASHP